MIKQNGQVNCDYVGINYINCFLFSQICGTLDSIRAKDFLPLEQQEREQQENWDWILI